MDGVLLAALGSLGLILGSFLNALLYRYNTGTSVVSGRSRCMRCGHALGALDLVPVLSYIFLRGRCRYCGTRISLQYPLVELAAAGLMIGVGLRAGDLLEGALTAFFSLTLLFVLVYDLRHYIIPWGALIVLMPLSLVLAFVHGGGVLDVLSGPILAAPLLFLSAVSKGRWMGWGDAPLELSVGWWLGLSAGFSALLLAFWTGAIVGVALIFFSSLRPPMSKTSRRGGYTMKSEVPFAPFLILGAWCSYFFHADIFQALHAFL